MLKCFIVLCLIASPNICQPEMEIVPADGPLTNPMQCARGALIYSAQGRMGEQTPEPDGQVAQPQWFVANVSSRLEGDGSDIVQSWLDEQRARAKRLEPQIK